MKKFVLLSTVLFIFPLAAHAASGSESQMVIENKATQGDADAQTELGFIYANGEGVPQNYQTAKEWFEKAANQGYATAQFKLGRMYDKGEGVPKNLKTAKDWYEKAANQGYATAQTNLGFIYVNGEGIPKNLQAAKEWFEKAANQGDADAQAALRMMHTDNNKPKAPQKTVKKTVTPSQKKAIKPVCVGSKELNSEVSDFKKILLENNRGYVRAEKTMKEELWALQRLGSPSLITSASDEMKVEKILKNNHVIKDYQPSTIAQGILDIDKGINDLRMAQACLDRSPSINDVTPEKPCIADRQIVLTILDCQQSYLKN